MAIYFDKTTIKTGNSGQPVIIKYDEGYNDGYNQGLEDAEPVLQEKIITPSTSNQIVSADTNYDGLSKVTVNGDADLTAANIKKGIEVFGITGTYTGDATATTEHILSGKTAYVNGEKITGTITSKTAATYTPSTSNQIITAGQYLSGDQTILGDADLVAGNIKSGANIFNVAGTYTSDATATAANILSGKTAYVKGAKVTGTIASKAAATITPTTSNQTIASGQYLSGTQTIVGDADLTAGNIKSGVNIFGVDGTFTSDADATAAQILSGKTAYVKGAKVIGSITSKAAATYTPTTSNQTISAGQYLNGAQTIAGDADLVAGNIVTGKNIFNVAGTFSADATAAANNILSGKTAYVKGSKVTGTIASKAAATYTPKTTDQTIASGQYLSGVQTIKGDANLIAENIKENVSIFGVTGNLKSGGSWNIFCQTEEPDISDGLWIKTDDATAVEISGLEATDGTTQMHDTILPQNASACEAVECNGLIYLIGGVTTWNNGTYMPTQVYDPSTDILTSKTSNPGMFETSGVAHNGIIYLFGRYRIGPYPYAYTCDNYSYRYDPQTDTYTGIAYAPTSGNSGCLAVAKHNGIAYILGGAYNSEGYLPNRTIGVYDFETGTFSTKNARYDPAGTYSGSITVWNPSAATFGDFIHILDRGDQNTYKVLKWSKYDVLLDVVTTVSGNIGCAASQLTRVGDLFYSLGGMWTTNQALDGKVRVLDPTTCTVSTLATMPASVMLYGQAFANGTLYAFGGSNNLSSTYFPGQKYIQSYTIYSTAYDPGTVIVVPKVDKSNEILLYSDGIINTKFAVDTTYLQTDDGLQNVEASYRTNNGSWIEI